MFKFARAISLLISLVGPALSWADAEPSVQMIYAQAQAGHYAQARQLLDQVLANHPHSGKAHFIAAELAMDRHDPAAARREFNLAETYSPGLAFATPEAVSTLRAQIGASYRPATFREQEPNRFPVSAVWILVAAVILGWMVFRRPGGTRLPICGSTGGYGPPTGSPIGGAGIGSTLLGGLASGVAMGAGVVAGEELAQHFLDAGKTSPPAPITDLPTQDSAQPLSPDFGVTDTGDWDTSPSPDSDWT